MPGTEPLQLSSTDTAKKAAQVISRMDLFLNKVTGIFFSLAKQGRIADDERKELERRVKQYEYDRQAISDHLRTGINNALDLSNLKQFISNDTQPLLDFLSEQSALKVADKQSAEVITATRGLTAEILDEINQLSDKWDAGSKKNKNSGSLSLIGNSGEQREMSPDEKLLAGFYPLDNEDKFRGMEKLERRHGKEWINRKLSSLGLKPDFTAYKSWRNSKAASNMSMAGIPELQKENKLCHRDFLGHFLEPVLEIYSKLQKLDSLKKITAAGAAGRQISEMRKQLGEIMIALKNNLPNNAAEQYLAIEKVQQIYALMQEVFVPRLSDTIPDIEKAIMSLYGNDIKEEMHSLFVRWLTPAWRRFMRYKNAL
ncbi:MAG: hypothetical protein A2096_10360 [Spirochaetes bacterium GWF1_41_5]|nr:MAG: hypothetical protein A2096_10360 [Spirochaetes bacterium GWF1_41_5]